ncbi:uncharacterized protein [Drosophila suzukii]|uniref:Uncharacterized protein n=1 Tax=Drosophila suzukii TaxID=28584 RepID=A0ABM4TT03_DROSZ
MENLTNKEQKDCTKQEPDTLKKSEVVTNDDRKSKITAPTTPVHVTSTPAKASEQRSRLSPTRHSDKPKPPTSVGVANQPLQPEGSAKAGLVVSTRAKEFERIPLNQAGPLNERKLATNPIREDQTSKLDYLKIQENIAWANAVIPVFDIAMTTSNSNKRERSMESAQPASKKAKVTNRGTWSRSFAEVVKVRKIIGVIDQSDEGGRIPRNQWGLVRRDLASVALKVLDENPGPPPDCTDAGWYQGNVKLIACEDERSAALYKAAINKVSSRLDRERGCGCRRNPRNQRLYSAC